MKTSNYLKVVLTIIAINLSLLVLQNAQILPTATAADEPQKQHVLVPVNADGSIDVRVQSIQEVLEVDLVKIKGEYIGHSQEVVNNLNTGTDQPVIPVFIVNSEE